MDALPRLTAAEAAARLGVKPESLYAYVSRGLLSRERGASGSTFDPLEVEAFARGRRRAPASRSTDGASASGLPLGVLETDIAQVEDDTLFFRGRDAVRLARESDLESVAAWLWGLPDAAALRRLGDDPDAVAAARALVRALPTGATLLDRMQAAVTALAASDPLRRDACGPALARAGARLLSGIPRALADAPVPDPVDTAADVPRAPADTAATLWTALAGRAPEPAEHRAISAALVLTVDHDLAVSTLAARVAASARGSGYAAVTAALGAFDGPLHGSASRAAAELLARVRDGEPVDRALASAVRDSGRGVPGFGHPLYAGIDPRAAALLPLVARMPGAGPVAAAVDAVIAEVERRAGVHPNLDLALGALVVVGALPPDAGSLVFATGRLTGWIAHAIAEYEEPPMRLRPRGRYVGP
ncbi:citrate/2-methylcitrate synthase [Microbacterium sp. X-17]|uniref:citrate/2-methylcitrate synthase n=1 Tax=Microbacterium sp. X-17 TaxID=3144404 RepID=UPI0031F4B593